ncbi:MAG: Uma2 family endonuclease [Akkermansiaceae bacterium]|nr:Uma2 family endonuclease [Armatimonadota bacterium]
MATVTAIPAPKADLSKNGADGTHPLLTWEDYLTEGTIRGHYDIVGGVRYFMASPKLGHQRVALRVARRLETYEEAVKTGRVFPAPCDVLIRRTPKLQVRQPDCLYVTNDRLARQANYWDAGYLAVTPDLIVEILPDSDTPGVLSEKLADYFTIGVGEAWLIRPDERTVAVMVRGLTEWTEAARYDDTQTLQSATLPDLSAPVADIFQP